MAPTSPSKLREKIRRFILAVFLCVLGVAAVAFSLDFIVFRIRVAANKNPYGSVTVNHYYAVLMKNGKTQFIFDPPAPETCVHSLFPHSGSMPCWYLTRHPDRRTDI